MKRFKIRTYNDDLLFDAINAKCELLGIGQLGCKLRDHAHLYCEGAYLTWTGICQEKFFQQNDYPEITINELFEMGLSPRETIKIGDSVYDKQEFEQATKDLKPINHERL